MPTLLPIEKVACPGRASIREALFCHSSDVENIVFDPFERVVAIQMASGGKWYRASFEAGEGFLNQSHRRNGGVMDVNQSLFFMLGGMNPDTRQTLRLIAKWQSLHALVKDELGQWHYAGVSYIAERDTWVSEKLNTQGGNTNTDSDQRSGVNRYQRQFGCISNADAPFLIPGFDFSTLTIEEPDPQRLTGDVQPPRELFFFPENASLDVPPSTSQIFVYFNEGVQLGASGTIRLRAWADDSLVQQWDVASPGTFLSVDYQQQAIRLTRNPATALPYETGYYLEADAGTIVDFSGNQWAGLSKPATVAGPYYFRTQQEPDTTPPVITTLSPPDDSIYAQIFLSPHVATFDEPIVAGSGVIELRDLGNAGAVVATFDVVSSSRVTVSGSTLSILLQDLITANSEYEIYIPAGAVTDAALNDFVGTTSGQWTFTTGPNTTSGFSTGFTTGFTS